MTDPGICASANPATATATPTHQGWLSTARSSSAARKSTEMNQNTRKGMFVIAPPKSACGTVIGSKGHGVGIIASTARQSSRNQTR